MRATPVPCLIVLALTLIGPGAHASAGIEVCQNTLRATVPPLLEDPISLGEMTAARRVAARLAPLLSNWSQAPEDLKPEKLGESLRAVRAAGVDLDHPSVRDLFFVIQRSLLIAKGLEGRLRPLASTLQLDEGKARVLVTVFAQLDALAYSGRLPAGAPAFLRDAVDPERFIASELGTRLTPELKRYLNWTLVPVLRQRLRYARLRVNQAGNQLILLTPVGVYRLNLMAHAVERPAIASPHVSTTDAWGRRNDRVIHAQVDVSLADPEAQSYLRTLIRADTFLHPHAPLPALELYPQPTVLSDFQEAQVQKLLAKRAQLRREQGLPRAISLGLQMSTGTGKNPMAMSYLSRVPLENKRADVKPKYIVALENTHVLTQFVPSSKRDLGLDPAKMAMLFGDLGSVTFGTSTQKYEVRRGHKLTPPMDWDFLAISRTTLWERREGMKIMIEAENRKPAHLRRPIRLLLDEGHHTGAARGEFSRMLDFLDGLLRPEDDILYTSATLDHEEMNLIRDRLGGAVVASHLEADELAELSRGERVLELARIQLLRGMIDGWLNPVEGRSFTVEDGTNDNQIIRDRLKRTRDADETLYEYVAELIRATRGGGGGYDRGLIFEPLKDRARAGAKLLQKLLGGGGDPETGAPRAAWYANSDLSTDEGERRVNWFRNLGAYRGGRFMHQYLVTVSQFLEGIDIPDVNLLVIMRNFRSLIAMMQLVGRGARIEAFKTGVRVIDVPGVVLKWLEDAGVLWRRVGLHQVSTITDWGRPAKDGLRLVEEPPPVDLNLSSRQLDLEPALQRERARADQWRQVSPTDVGAAAAPTAGVLQLLARTPDGAAAQTKVSLATWFSYFYDRLPAATREQWAKQWRALDLPTATVGVATLGEHERQTAIQAFRLLARIFNGYETLHDRLGLAQVTGDEALTIAGFKRVRLGLNPRPSFVLGVRGAHAPSLRLVATPDDHRAELREYLRDGVMFAGLSAEMNARLLAGDEGATALSTLQLLVALVAERPVLAPRYGGWLRRLVQLGGHGPSATSRDARATYLLGQFMNTVLRDANLTGLKPLNLNGLVGGDLDGSGLASTVSLYDILATLDLVEHRLGPPASEAPAPVVPPAALERPAAVAPESVPVTPPPPPLPPPAPVVEPDDGRPLGAANWDRATEADIDALTAPGGQLRLLADGGPIAHEADLGNVFANLIKRLPAESSVKWRKPLNSIRLPRGRRPLSTLRRSELAQFVRALRLVGAILNDLAPGARMGLAPFVGREMTSERALTRINFVISPELDLHISPRRAAEWTGPVLKVADANERAHLTEAYQARRLVLADDARLHFGAWAAKDFAFATPRQILGIVHEALQQNASLRDLTTPQLRAALERQADVLESTIAPANQGGVLYAIVGYVMNRLILARGLSERPWDLNPLFADEFAVPYDRAGLNTSPSYADVVRILEQAARPPLHKSLVKAGLTTDDVLHLRHPRGLLQEVGPGGVDLETVLKSLIGYAPESVRRRFAADLGQLKYAEFPRSNQGAPLPQLEHFARGLLVLNQIYNALTPIERHGFSPVAERLALTEGAFSKASAALALHLSYPVHDAEGEPAPYRSLRENLDRVRPGLTPAPDLFTIFERLVDAIEARPAVAARLTAPARDHLRAEVIRMRALTEVPRREHQAAHLIARLVNDLIDVAKLNGVKPFDLNPFGWPELGDYDRTGLNLEPTLDDVAAVLGRILPAAETTTTDADQVTDAEYAVFTSKEGWPGILTSTRDVAQFFTALSFELPRRLRDEAERRLAEVKLPPGRTLAQLSPTEVRLFIRGLKVLADLTGRYTPRERLGLGPVKNILTAEGGQLLCLLLVPDLPLPANASFVKAIDLDLAPTLGTEHARLIDDLRSERLLPGGRTPWLDAWIARGGPTIEYGVLASEVINFVRRRPALAGRLTQSTIEYFVNALAAARADAATAELTSKFVLARLLNVLIVSARLDRKVLNLNGDFDPTRDDAFVTRAATWRDVFEILDAAEHQSASDDVALDRTNWEDVTPEDLERIGSSKMIRAMENGVAGSSRRDMRRELDAAVNQLPTSIRAHWRKQARELKLPRRLDAEAARSPKERAALARWARLTGAMFNECSVADRLGLAPLARNEVLESDYALTRMDLALDPNQHVDPLDDLDGGYTPRISAPSAEALAEIRAELADGRSFLSVDPSARALMVWVESDFAPMDEAALVHLVSTLITNQPKLRAALPAAVFEGIAKVLRAWPTQNPDAAARATFWIVGVTVNHLIRARALDQKPWDLNPLLGAPTLAYAREELNTAPSYADLFRVLEAAARPDLARDLAQAGVAPERLLGLARPGGLFDDGVDLNAQIQLAPANVRARFSRDIQALSPELIPRARAAATWPGLEATARALHLLERMFGAMNGFERLGLAPLPANTVFDRAHLARVLAANRLGPAPIAAGGFASGLGPVANVGPDEEARWVRLAGAGDAFALLERTLAVIDESPKLKAIYAEDTLAAAAAITRDLGAEPDRTRRIEAAAYALGWLVNDALRRAHVETVAPWDLNRYFGLTPGREYETSSVNVQPTTTDLVNLLRGLDAIPRLTDDAWSRVGADELRIAKAPGGILDMLARSYGNVPFRARSYFKFWIDTLPTVFSQYFAAELRGVDLPNVMLMPRASETDQVKLVRAFKFMTAALNTLAPVERLGFLPFAPGEALRAEAFKRIDLAVSPVTKLELAAGRGRAFEQTLGFRPLLAIEFARLDDLVKNADVPDRARLTSFVSMLGRMAQGPPSVGLLGSIVSLLEYYPRVNAQLGPAWDDQIKQVLAQNEDSEPARVRALLTLARLVNHLIRHALLTDIKPWNVNGAFESSERPAEYGGTFNPSPSLLDVIEVFEAVNRRGP